MLSRSLLAALAALALAAPALGAVPDSLDVVCDVDRRVFRTQAKNESAVTFTLWPSPTGGSPCGTHVVPMSALIVYKAKTDSFDAQRPRKFGQVRATLGTAGSSGTPVALCSGGDTWLDIQVGSNLAIGCDFAGSPQVQQRRRLQAVPFAKQCETCSSVTEVSARVFRSMPFSTNNAAGIAVAFDGTRWNTGGVTQTATALCAPTPGKYFIYGHAGWDANGAGLRSIAIKLNGATYLASVGAPGSAIPAANDQVVSTHYDLADGDCVELEAFQTSGVGLNIRHDPNFSPEFGIVKVP